MSATLTRESLVGRSTSVESDIADEDFDEGHRVAVDPERDRVRADLDDAGVADAEPFGDLQELAVLGVRLTPDRQQL